MMYVMCVFIIYGIRYLELWCDFTIRMGISVGNPTFIYTLLDIEWPVQIDIIGSLFPGQISV